MGTVRWNFIVEQTFPDSLKIKVEKDRNTRYNTFIKGAGRYTWPLARWNFKKLEKQPSALSGADRLFFIVQETNAAQMRKGKNMIYTMHYDSPIGRLLLAEKEEALAGLWIEGQKYYPVSMKEETQENPSSAVLNLAKEWLDGYFQGKSPAVNQVPLAPAGSEFRQQVWKILCEIPYGQVTTYGEISKKIAASRGLDRMSAQAVGGAVSHNPISIIIPCHRVVGTNGSLTGYAGGIQKKIELLTLEGADMRQLFIPKELYKDNL